MAAAHFRSQLFGDDGCVSAVMDDLRPNEEDQFGAGDRVVLRTECVPNNRDSVQDGNAGMGDVLSFLDQSGEQHGLPVRDRQLALHSALGNRRSQIGGRGGGDTVSEVIDHGADFLLDVEKDGAVGIYPRLNL